MRFSLFEDYKTAPVGKILLDLQTGENGLDEKTASHRLAIFGHNEPVKRKKISLPAKFVSRFNDPLIIILLAAAVVSGFVNQIKNAIIIFWMVVVSVIMNLYQEHRSGKAAEKLLEKLAVTSTVVRSEKKREIPTSKIVPGDIVLLSAGDIIPADGRIIKCNDFFVNESSLTGESFPVEKTTIGEKDKSKPVAYAGTTVVSGYASIVAVRTGENTESGSIAAKIQEPEEVNAFEAGIRDFGFLVMKVAIFIVLSILVINLYLERDILESFLFSIAVAVGITPELLPVVLSINMTKGSLKMAKKGAIVKRLNAIPDFGSMDILCTDKTGTLTEDKITVVRYIDIFGKTSEDVLRLAYINGYLETGIKSPLEEATLNFKHINVDGVKKIDEIPYDFFRKRLSVVMEEKGKRTMITKGAPEEVIKISGFYFDGKNSLGINKEMIGKINNFYNELSGQGYRVLAVARKDFSFDDRTVYSKSEENGMSFCGFIAYYDPPKESAKNTLRFMASHGIEIKIVTGDSPLVTKKICRDLDFKIKGMLIGDDMDKMTDEALSIKVEEANIFARFSPNQKNRVISALRKNGKVVGYLGDGINDALSLKTADVGISVSNAVDIAKETADVILMHKSLKELIDGVLEGRKTFGNTMKYLMMGLSSNFGNMFSMIAAIIFLPFLPMLPVQILFNNFLYDTSQMALPADNVDTEYLKKPKHWNMSFVKYFTVVFGPVSSVFDIATFFILYYVLNFSEKMFQTGWFIESLATQVLVIFIIRTKMVPFFRSKPGIFLIVSAVSIITVGLAFVTTPIGRYLGFTPLSGAVLGVILSLVALYLVIVEIVKLFFYRKFKM